MTGTLPPGSCADHPRYRAGCTDCATTAAERRRVRNRMVAYGTWQDHLVDAGPVREHLELLTASCLSRLDIARASRVAKSAIDRIINAGGRTNATTVERILAVDPATVTPSRVSSLGAARRLRSLLAGGWDSASLAPLLGCSESRVKSWRFREYPTISYAAHQQICQVFTDIGDRPGPSAVARGVAAANGYLPPIYWDDDGDLDNPRSRPHAIGLVAA